MPGVRSNVLSKAFNHLYVHSFLVAFLFFFLADWSALRYTNIWSAPFGKFAGRRFWLMLNAHFKVKATWKLQNMESSVRGSIVWFLFS